MSRFKLAGAPGQFNIFSSKLCARAMRHIALVGEIKQRDLMTYYAKVIGGRGQFTFAFARFCCGAVEDAHDRETAIAEVREVATTDLVVYHAYIKGTFRGGFDTREAAEARIAQWRTATSANPCDQAQHLIARLRTPTGRDSADRHNRVRYIGREPAVWVASLNDRALHSAYEALEQQQQLTTELHADEHADLVAWMDLVRGETETRAGHIGRTQWDAHRIATAAAQAATAGGI